MTAIRIRSWETWQGRAYREILRKREARAKAGAQSRVKAIQLPWIALAVEMDSDPHVEHFASELGDNLARWADAFWVRTLQYAARKSPESGRIAVKASKFGPLVLSSPHHIVSPAVGRKVHAALLVSTLCVLDAGAPKSGRGRAVAAPTGDDGSGEEIHTPHSPPQVGDGDWRALPWPEPEAASRVLKAWASRRSGNRAHAMHHAATQLHKRLMERRQQPEAWLFETIRRVEADDAPGFTAALRSVRKTARTA